jgi:colicin import membrane protein
LSVPVTGFWREHGVMLVGSVLLHGVVVGIVLVLTFWSSAPKIIPPATIEAYLAPAPARREAVRQVAVTPDVAPAVEAAPTETPPPQTQAPAPRKAEVAPVKIPVPKAVEKPAPAPKAPPAVDATLEMRHAKAERQKVAEQEAARIAAEARREAAQQQAEATARKAQVEATARQRSQRESELARALAGEQSRSTENAGLLNRYIAEIQARVERAWNRPPSAQPGLKCEVFVTQVPGGTVTQVRIGQCNGDAAVQQSISVAVFRASPLPAPSDPSLFERNLKLVFAPDA